MRDHVLIRDLSDVPNPATMTDAEAFRSLEALLTPRLAEADAGQVVHITSEDIKRGARLRQSRK